MIVSQRLAPMIPRAQFDAEAVSQSMETDKQAERTKLEHEVAAEPY